MTARVRVYADNREPFDRLVAEFDAVGGMHRTDREAPLGACFYVTPIDYGGLDPSYTRAETPHLLILHRFDWHDRRGEYIHMPYRGRIEIEATG